MSRLREPVKKRGKTQEDDDEVDPSSSESESISESENPSIDSNSESESSSDHENNDNDDDVEEEPELANRNDERAERNNRVVQIEIYDDGDIVIERRREKKRPREIPVPNVVAAIAPPAARARGRRPPSPPRPNLAVALNALAGPPIIHPPRRQPARRAAAGLREAFTLLINDDLDGFLDLPIIQDLLYPAFKLLKNEFQSGYGQQRMTSYWMMHWYSDLHVRSLKNYRVRGKCVACKRTRALKYVLNQIGTRDISYYKGLKDDIDGDGFIGVMGCDCFEVKFAPLMRLADLCLKITTTLEENPDQTGFDELVHKTLGPTLAALETAPARMKERNNYV